MTDVKPRLKKGTNPRCETCGLARDMVTGRCPRAEECALLKRPQKRRERAQREERERLKAARVEHARIGIRPEPIAKKMAETFAGEQRTYADRRAWRGLRPKQRGQR